MPTGMSGFGKVGKGEKYRPIKEKWKSITKKEPKMKGRGQAQRNTQMKRLRGETNGKGQAQRKAQMKD